MEKKEKESWSSKNSVVMDRIKNLMVYSKCFNYARILNLENLKQSALLKEVGTHENILQKEKEVERRKWKSNVIPPHRDNDWSIFKRTFHAQFFLVKIEWDHSNGFVIACFGPRGMEMHNSSEESLG